MTKLALSVAAMLLASSSAFAGSDHFGADNANQPVASVDTNATASITYTAQHNGVDAKVMTGPSQGSVQDIINRHNQEPSS
jgi:Skp family chaperone for outer membrane proteins